MASERHRLHHPRTEFVMGEVVPAAEVPERVDDILGSVAAHHDVREPVDHGVEPLRAIHDRGYLEHLESAWRDWRAAGGRSALVADTFPVRLQDRTEPPGSAEARAGWWCFDASSPILEGTYVAARAAADCALTAADAVLAGARAAYALCRPPGHHAGTDCSGGYCYLNNAAAAAALIARNGAGAAVLDLDYHHGNGTQRIFWEDRRVLYVSLHADPDVEYPYYWGRAEEVGGGGAEGTTQNLPLPLGTGDPDYLRTAEAAMDRIAGSGAGAVVVSLGLDAFEGDPMGRFSLSLGAYGLLGGMVRELGLPAVVVQEGGYAVGSLGSLAVAFLGGLESPADAEPTTSA